ncbi:MAG TPA: HEPN domain-containing protein [Blastocatellia bacterium]|nr:HEPN domain-containing protein [Blastocatellia bacterium]
MFKSFAVEGVWFLPDTPNQQVAGVLTFDNDDGIFRPMLRLTGSPPPLSVPQPAFYPVVLGCQRGDGREVTLLECSGVTHLDNPLRLPESGLLTAETCLVGTHFPSGDVRPTALAVHFVILDEWARSTGLHIESEPGNFFAVTARYSPAEPIPLAAYGDETYSLHLYQSHSRGFRNFSINERVYLVIEPKGEPKGMEHLVNLMFLLQQFLTLAADQAVSPEIIKITVLRGTEEQWPGGPLSEQADLFLPVHAYHAVAQPPSPYSLGFTMASAGNRMGTILSSWLDKAKSLSAMRALYFAPMFNQKQYVDSSFLSLATAAESYHSGLSSGSTKEPKNQFRVRKERILQAVDEADREWLAEVLTHANALTLRDRLTALVGESSLAAKMMLVDPADITGSVARIVDTRNYLTHGGRKGKNVKDDPQSLYHMTRFLHVVLRECLLKEIGFSQDEANGITGRLQYREVKGKV